MMETVFLWLVVCLDGQPCANQQVFKMDTFTGAAAMSDCQAAKFLLGVNLVQVARTPGQRVTCKTLAQFKLEGLSNEA